MSLASLKQFQLAFIYWVAGRIVNQLGALGLIGLGLILASALLFGLTVASDNAELLTVQEQLNEKKSNAEELKSQQKTELHKPEVFDFYSAFPMTSDLSTTLQAVKNTATKNRLELTRGDYKFTLISKSKTKVQDIAKYEIKIPLSGNYLQIRTFINEILMQLPTLALSDVQLKRENSLSPKVDANLTFIFFARGIS